MKFSRYCSFNLIPTNNLSLLFKWPIIAFTKVGSKNSMPVWIQIHIPARIQKYSSAIFTAILNIPFRKRNFNARFQFSSNSRWYSLQPVAESNLFSCEITWIHVGEINAHSPHCISNSICWSMHNLWTDDTISRCSISVIIKSNRHLKFSYYWTTSNYPHLEVKGSLISAF